MRQFILFTTACFISAFSFAAAPSSATLENALGSAWKAEQSMHAKQNPNEFAIVYGGEDISNKPTLATHTTTV
jgi:hypothetical protein